MSQATPKQACLDYQDKVARRLQGGCRYFHIGWQNATVVFLAQNSAEAFGLFRLWLRLNPQCEPHNTHCDFAIVDITDTTTTQFGIFAGRRDGKARIQLISTNN